jgi:hypothetical protein
VDHETRHLLPATAALLPELDEYWLLLCLPHDRAATAAAPPLARSVIAT